MLIKSQRELNLGHLHILSDLLLVDELFQWFDIKTLLLIQLCSPVCWILGNESSLWRSLYVNERWGNGNKMLYAFIHIHIHSYIYI